jgi:hypothetical protein
MRESELDFDWARLIGNELNKWTEFKWSNENRSILMESIGIVQDIKRRSIVN